MSIHRIETLQLIPLSRLMPASAKKTFLKKKTVGNIGSQSTKSEAEEQFLPDCRAVAHMKEVFFFTETGILDVCRVNKSCLKNRLPENIVQSVTAP